MFLSKLLASTLLIASLMSGATASEKCGVVVDVPPGGAGELYARLLKKYNSDFDIVFRPGGLTVPAINHLRSNPTHIYLGVAAIMGNRSPMSNPPIELYRILIASPIMAITVKDISEEDLLNKPLNIGIPAFNTAHDLIANQIKDYNSNIEIVSTKGNNGALPLVINGVLDLFLVSATDGRRWVTQFPQIKTIFTSTLNESLYLSNKVKINNLGFNSAFIYKNGSEMEKATARRCLDRAIFNPGWTQDLEKIGANPVNIHGQEADRLLAEFIKMLNKYGK